MKRTLQEAWRGYRARTLTAWIAMGVTALLLLIFGSAVATGAGFYLFLQNVRKAFVVDVYLERGQTSRTRQDIQTTLASLGGVERVEFVDRKEATRDFLSRYPQYQRFFRFFVDVPFPDHFRVIPKPHWRTSRFLTYLEEVARSLPGVEDAYAGGRWLGRLERFTFLLTLISGSFLLVVFLALSIVVSQTIRLTVLARHEVVHLLLLQGAPLSMVRAPFELLGSVYAGMGGLLAALGVWVLLRVLNRVLLPYPREVEAGILAGVVLFALLMGYASARSTMDDLLDQELPV